MKSEDEEILKRIKGRQKQLEDLSQYLNELESQLSLLFSYSPDLIILTKEDGEIIKVNQTTGIILGYSAEEMVGMDVWDFVAPEDLEETIKFKNALILEGGIGFTVKNDICFINHWKKKNGGYARLVWRYAFFDQKNRWMIKFATDFSDAPVDSPFISNLVLRAIDCSAAGFIITDNKLPENPIIYANKEFCNASGYTRKQIIGQNCRFLNSTDRDQKALSTLRDSLKSGRGVDVLLKNFKANGEPWFNFLIIEPVIEDGKITKFIGSSRDVTRQVEDGEIIWDRSRPRGFGVADSNVV